MTTRGPSGAVLPPEELRLVAFAMAAGQLLQARDILDHAIRARSSGRPRALRALEHLRAATAWLQVAGETLE